MEQSENRGLLTESGYAELQEAKKSIKKETMNLEKLKSNQKASKKYRKKKKEAFQALVATNPGAESIITLHEHPGRSRLENEDNLIKTITEIAMYGSSVDEKRRSEIIRSCRTLDDLHKKLTDLGFEISRSATYIRLIPRKSRSLEGKSHVKTAPVRLIRAQEDYHKSHPDTAFCVASIRRLECLASLLGDDSAFISQDDKARVPIGLTAANKQAPFMMHMDYLVRLPDHTFVVGPGHKLIPSVYAGCRVNETKPIGQPDGVSYSGPTYVAIRSGKHSSSTAATHAQDFERLLTLDNFKSILKTPSGVVKPVLIFTVDGGPDENPRYQKVIAYAVRHFLDHNLDYIAIACNAPGRSAFNRVERRMAPLSHQLAGLIIPHDKFGSHLDTQRRTTDVDLEKKNFKCAGETLANVWNEMVIDGESVVAEYICPDKPDPEIGTHPGPEWYTKHVMESQYMLQISKCSDLACCTMSRSKLRKILPDGFMPPPLLLTSNLEAAPPLKEDASFCPLYLQLALKVEVPLGHFKKLPYDFYCPTLQGELIERCCSKCGTYFASKTSMKEHKKNMKDYVHGSPDQVLFYKDTKKYF